MNLKDILVLIMLVVTLGLFARANLLLYYSVTFPTQSPEQRAERSLGFIEASALFIAALAWLSASAFVRFML